MPRSLCSLNLRQSLRWDIDSNLSSGAGARAHQGGFPIVYGLDGPFLVAVQRWMGDDIRHVWMEHPALYEVAHGSAGGKGAREAHVRALQERSTALLLDGDEGAHLFP